MKIEYKRNKWGGLFKIINGKAWKDKKDIKKLVRKSIEEKQKASELKAKEDYDKKINEKMSKLEDNEYIKMLNELNKKEEKNNFEDKIITKNNKQDYNNMKKQLKGKELEEYIAREKDRKKRIAMAFKNKKNQK